MQAPERTFFEADVSCKERSVHHFWGKTMTTTWLLATRAKDRCCANVLKKKHGYGESSTSAIARADVSRC